MNQSATTTFLVEFSCASRPSADLADADILRMARQAWSRNTRAGITGSLRIEDGAFHQIVEGPSELLLPLVSRILTDPRHEAISIESFRPVARRRFADWRVHGIGADASAGIADGAADEDATAFPVNVVATAGIARR